MMMVKPFKLSRRDFLKVGLVSSTALVLGIPFDAQGTDDSIPYAHTGKQFTPSAYISIDEQDLITLVIPEIEMGQGVKTSLAMILAEELEADWEHIRIVIPNSLSTLGTIGTSSSMSIRSNWEKLLHAGAAAREILRTAAAIKWNVSVNECNAVNGKIIHTRSKRSFKYGELVPIANSLPIPSEIKLKDSKQYRFIGTDIQDYDGANKVNGKTIYGIDVQLPNMLHATVVHCPIFGGKVKSFDARNALKIPGVENIFQIENGVAIVAKTFWLTKKAANTIHIEWHHNHDKLISSEELKLIYQTALEQPGKVLFRHGDNLTTDNGKDHISETYAIPFQSHAQMEPINCTAHVQKDLCEVWAPTQNTYGAQYESAKYYYSTLRKKLRGLKKRLGMETDFSDILVHPTMIGGAFGRRLMQDYVGEAVQISKTIQKPVKVIWTREEDMQHGFYRPFTVHRIKSRLDKNGMPNSWHHHIVGPDERLCVGGATNLPYNIPNIDIQFTASTVNVPVGSWRSVGYSHNITIIETFINKLAKHANIDPLEYRLALLSEEQRCKKVLQLAALHAGWNTQNKSERYLGIALVKAYGSCAAQVAEVSIENNKMKVHKITCTVDCGVAVNPDTIRAQIEGGIAFGMTATLKSAINIQGGKVVESNFHDFPILAIDEMPVVEVIIVESDHKPGGIGELAVPPIAPAILNAIFAANGSFITTLPVSAESFSNKIHN